ncbi:hypothetical protein [Patulibacter defluvii]|uniref:hypothetical protein n=1 Tax=Patulibacter defluvii TaxID=3095358 RepID=UPI002A7486E6|nr:hypothetical protein [Patulibacter sp. DM4]
MSDRKRKRKRQAARTKAAASRRPSHEAGGVRATAEPPAPTAPAPGGRGAMTRGYAKAEAKNQAVRDALEPLAPGERPAIIPWVVVWLLVIAAGMVYSAITADGDNAAGTRASNVLMVILIAVAAIGTWRLRYWAILGTQTILALAVVVGFIALMSLTKAWLLPIAIGQPVISALLFYRMVKVMARVQKTDRMRQESNSAA